VRKSHPGYKYLSAWCGNMRSSNKEFELKGKSARLTKEKIKCLNDIGFEWTGGVYRKNSKRKY